MDPYTCYRCWKSSKNRSQVNPRSHRPQKSPGNLWIHDIHVDSVCLKIRMPKKNPQQQLRSGKRYLEVEGCEFPSKKSNNYWQTGGWRTHLKHTLLKSDWHIRATDFEARHGMAVTLLPWLGWIFSANLGWFPPSQKKVLFEDSCRKVKTSGLKRTALQLHLISLRFS